MPEDVSKQVYQALLKRCNDGKLEARMIRKKLLFSLVYTFVQFSACGSKVK